MAHIAWNQMPGVVKVKLRRDWRGADAGSIVEVDRDAARQLIYDNFADLHRDHTPKNKRARVGVAK